jgi:hypothetical protein
MGRVTNASETPYVLLFVSMLGFLFGLGLLVYDWPQPCGAMVPCPNYFPYTLVIFGILIVLASVGLMTFSIRSHVH